MPVSNAMKFKLGHYLGPRALAQSLTQAVNIEEFWLGRIKRKQLPCPAWPLRSARLRLVCGAASSRRVRALVFQFFR